MKRRAPGVSLQSRHPDRGEDPNRDFLGLRPARSALESLGVGPDTGVAMCLRNEVEFYEVSVGAGALGAYAVPINWHFVPDEVRYILEDSGATVLVVHADLLRRFADAIRANIEVR